MATSTPEKAGSDAIAKAAAEPVKSPRKTAKPAKEKKPTDKLADKTLLTRILQGIFGDAQKKTLHRMYKKVMEIGKLEPKYEAMSDTELAQQTEILKSKLKDGSEKELNEILVDAFAVEREAAKRILARRTPGLEWGCSDGIPV